MALDLNHGHGRATGTGRRHALVLAAGTPDGWGVALNGGTGSIAYGRDGQGRAARAGGWGYVLGDDYLVRRDGKVAAYSDSVTKAFTPVFSPMTYTPLYDGFSCH